MIHARFDVQVLPTTGVQIDVVLNLIAPGVSIVQEVPDLVIRRNLLVGGSYTATVTLARLRL
jgi:hypothetical protein